MISCFIGNIPEETFEQIFQDRNLNNYQQNMVIQEILSIAVTKFLEQKNSKSVIDEIILNAKKVTISEREKHLNYLISVYNHSFMRSYERTVEQNYGDSWRESGLLGSLNWIFHKAKRLKSMIFKETKYGTLNAPVVNLIHNSYKDNKLEEHATLFGHLIDLFNYCALSLTTFFEYQDEQMIISNLSKVKFKKAKED